MMRLNRRSFMQALGAITAGLKLPMKMVKPKPKTALPPLSAGDGVSKPSPPIKDWPREGVRGTVSGKYGMFRCKQARVRGELLDWALSCEPICVSNEMDGFASFTPGPSTLECSVWVGDGKQVDRMTRLLDDGNPVEVDLSHGTGRWANVIGYLTRVDVEIGVSNGFVMQMAIEWCKGKSF